MAIVNGWDDDGAVRWLIGVLVIMRNTLRIALITMLLATPMAIAATSTNHCCTKTAHCCTTNCCVKK